MSGVRDGGFRAGRARALVRVVEPEPGPVLVDRPVAAGDVVAIGARVGVAVGGDSGAVGGPVQMGRRVLNVHDVRGFVLREYGVPLVEFCGRGRHPRVVEARGVFVYLARARTYASYPEIAVAMKPEGAASNHSTAITAMRRIERKMSGDGRLRDRVARVQGAIDVRTRGWMTRAVEPYAVEVS